MRFAETAPPSNKVALNRIVGRFCMILLRRPFGGIRFAPVPGPLGLAGLLHPAELDESLEMVADGALDGRGGGGRLGPRRGDGGGDPRAGPGLSAPIRRRRSPPYAA